MGSGQVYTPHSSRSLNRRCSSDESTSALFEFRPSGIVCDQSCLAFAASFVAKNPSIQSRDAYLAYRRQVEPNQSGVFKIVAEKAVDLPSVRWVGRQDPYVRLALLPYVTSPSTHLFLRTTTCRWNEPVQTKAAMSGGKNPVWLDAHANEMRLQHRCNSSNNPVPALEVQVWNDNYMFTHDLLASSLVSTSPLLQHPGISVSRWFTLISPSSVSSKPTNQHARVFFTMQFDPQPARPRRLQLSSEPADVRDHKFRVHSLKTVGMCLLSCGVCDRVIVSTTMTQWGYRCESCGIDVHKACMMLANTNLPCVHVCSKYCKPCDNVHAANVFEGDTYCRLSVDGMRHETKEVYKSADPVFDDRTCFDITNRDTAFQLEVVDLATNVAVGSMTLLLFELLQMDADDVVRSCVTWCPLLESFHASSQFNCPKTSFPLKLKANVVGHARLTLHYAEAKQKLLLYVPKQRMVLQGREEKDFSVETLKTNIDRLARVLRLAPWLEQQYLAIITWKRPVHSGAVLILFAAACLFVDAEHMPVFGFVLAIAYMLHTLWQRVTGAYVLQWAAYDNDVMEGTRLFRPVATLLAAVVDAELPPTDSASSSAPYVFVRVVYIPNDSDQDDSGLISSGGDEYLVGRTHAVRHTARPTWRDGSNVVSHLAPPGLFRPNAPPKKEHVFRNAHVSWPLAQQQRNCKPATDYHTLVYPLLQAAKHFDNGRELLVPWTAFPGLLRFDVVETNDAGVCDTVVGSTTPLPLVRFIQGDEATLTLPLVLCHSNSTNSSLSTPSSTSLTVRLKVQLPDPNPTPHKQPDGAARPADKKWSTYVRDALAEKDAKAATLGTTLFGAFWKAKDTTTMVQNAVGRVCATVVCTQNLFNWTHPWKTATVFAACVGGAILFSIVQARNTARNVLWNFISSLPTDTDLIQAYDDQRKEYVATRTSAEVADAVACRRLKLQALWVGTVQVKMEHDRTWKEIPDLMARKPEDPPYILYVLGNTGESYQEKRFLGFASAATRDDLLHVIKASV
ncbi:hypothetical protein DYB25_000880 [Aphanomyces astaci]|uniref:Uncharacterized protein n=4 Tax=Aphanomyces astaci TaxID=112090 RepID=A0A397CP54_APHAT|nr:hypothetical protein DYB25_000880 [Aphanomyces astaci]RHY46639.1 hypothetical protein DYB30_001249 [Aphanomyces astaci]